MKNFNSHSNASDSRQSSDFNTNLNASVKFDCSSVSSKTSKDKW
jgi:hypothetical protein